MNVQPGVSFEAVIDTGSPGKTGVFGVEMNDNLGGLVQAFSTAGLIEIAPGTYSVVKTAPVVLGQYTLVWRDSSTESVLGVEDLYVIATAVVPVGTPAPLPTVGGMTFKQIQDECVNFRFGEGRRNSVKLWINRRMQAVWGEAEWPFKRVNRATVVTDGAGMMVMPTGFRRAIAIEDSNGDELEFMDPEQFRDAYPPNQSAGTPAAYTTWNGQVLFNNNPGQGVAFQLSYLRRICVLDTNGYIKEGLLTLDTDFPLWDPEHHFMLVLGATSTGLKLENDFTWNALEDEFNAAMTEMKDDLLPPDVVGNTQFGADDLS